LVAAKPRVGVLALQGDVAEHEAALRRAGATPVRVRRAADLEGLDGLIIPGGESTTIGALAAEYGLLEPIRAFVRAGKPAWGTCAGLILLASSTGTDQPLIGGLDIDVDRNAFGRQVDSFETDLPIPALGAPHFPAVFIRAPAVRRAGEGVDVLARLDDGTIAAVAAGPLLGTAFHPELTGDGRLHELFLRMVEEARAARGERSAAGGGS
jgi:5'-phosphate synthase pdxT subunit